MVFVNLSAFVNKYEKGVFWVESEGATEVACNEYKDRCPQPMEGSRQNNFQWQPGTLLCPTTDLKPCNKRNNDLNLRPSGPLKFTMIVNVLRVRTTKRNELEMQKPGHREKYMQRTKPTLLTSAAEELTAARYPLSSKLVDRARRSLASFFTLMHELRMSSVSVAQGGPPPIKAKQLCWVLTRH